VHEVWQQAPTAKLLRHVHSMMVRLARHHVVLTFFLNSLLFLIASLTLVLGIFFSKWWPSEARLAPEFTIVTP